MGIRVQRNAVGPQLHDLRQRAIKRLRRLARQAVDQIDIDGIKPQRTRRFHQSKDLFSRLHAVHCFLHFCVEILHTKAQPVEPQLCQQRQPACIDGARVHFN